MRKLIVLTLTLVASLGLAISKKVLSTATQKHDIWMAVSGRAGPDDDFNPLFVIYKKWPRVGIQALGFINYNHPRDASEIRFALGLSELETDELLLALQKCGLVRWNSDRGYQVTFAVFDDKVWAVFEPIMNKVADTISQKVSADIVPLLRAQYQQSSFPKAGIPYGIIATIVTGAFGLDEAGVSDLERNDLIRVTKKQPGERSYVVLSGAAGSLSRFPLYGIHADIWAQVYFGTFGENQSMNRRQSDVLSLPDLIWNRRGLEKIPIDNFAVSLSKLVMGFRNDEFSPSDLRRQLPEDSEGLALQACLRYGLIEKRAEDGFRITFPVFSGNDLDRFAGIAAGIGTLVLEIVRESYPDFGEAYLKTNPSVHGVPLQEVMDLVYHHIYSLALSDMLSRHPEFKFSKEYKDLQYSGYARIK